MEFMNTSNLQRYVVYYMLACVFLLSCRKYGDDELHSFQLQAIDVRSDCECVISYALKDIGRFNCDEQLYANDLDRIRRTSMNTASIFNELRVKIDSCFTAKENQDRVFTISGRAIGSGTSIINKSEIFKELRFAIREAISNSHVQLPDGNFVAKPNEIPRTSIVSTRFQGQKVIHDILYLRHDERNINEILQHLEASLVLSQLTRESDNLIIQYPVSFHSEEQLETWSEFEKRLRKAPSKTSSQKK